MNTAELSEGYKTALRRFKEQAGVMQRGESGVGDSLPENKYAANHIYRLVMKHCIPVTELTEEQLAAFVSQGDMAWDYVDKEGLDYVNLEEDVQVSPLVAHTGTYFETIDGELYILQSADVKSMLSALIEMNQVDVIAKKLQSLSQRKDGVKLQSALPTIDEFNLCIKDGLVVPLELMEKIKRWGDMGASVICFDFVELTEVDA